MNTSRARERAAAGAARAQTAVAPAAPRAARERAPRAEEERLDGRLREVELVGDLAVGEALPLAQEERAPLRAPASRRAPRADRISSSASTCVRGHESWSAWRSLGDSTPAPARRGAQARQADVLGDLEEPGRLELGLDAALGARGRRSGRWTGPRPRPPRGCRAGAGRTREDLPGVALVQIRGAASAARRRLRARRYGCHESPPCVETARPRRPCLAAAAPAFKTLEKIPYRTLADGLRQAEAHARAGRTAPRARAAARG